MFWLGMAIGVATSMITLSILAASTATMLEREHDKMKLWMFQQFEESRKQVDDVFRIEPKKN